jgi:hypothetical protein
MRHGEDISVPRRAPSWRGLGVGLERWQETCLGSKGVELFGGPNTFDLRRAR